MRNTEGTSSEISQPENYWQEKRKKKSSIDSIRKKKQKKQKENKNWMEINL